jgi:hypothetical protein
MTSVAPARVARLHLDSLYRLDEGGRIIEICEPYPPPPPRFVLFRTQEEVLPIVGAGVPDALAHACCWAPSW